MGDVTLYLAREMPTIGGSTDPADFDNSIGILDKKMPYLYAGVSYPTPSGMDVSDSTVTAKISKDGKKVIPIQFKIRAQEWTNFLSADYWGITAVGPSLSAVFGDGLTLTGDGVTYGFWWRTISDDFIGFYPSKMRLKIGNILNCSPPDTIQIKGGVGVGNVDLSDVIPWSTVVAGDEFDLTYPDPIPEGFKIWDIISVIGGYSTGYFSFDYGAGGEPSAQFTELSFNKSL